MSKSKQLLELLKNGWISNWKACYYLKSAHADRWIRYIRANTPDNYKLEERIKKEKIEGRTIVYKEFRLIEKVMKKL